MTSRVYTEGANQLKLGGSVDFAGADVIKIMLVDDTYSMDPDETVLTTAAAKEISITGYTPGFGGSGRKTLASKTITKDTATDRIVYDAADPSAWTLSTGATVGGQVIYKHDTNDATSIPLFFLDGANTITNDGTVTVAFAATGIAYLQL